MNCSHFGSTERTLGPLKGRKAGENAVNKFDKCVTKRWPLVIYLTLLYNTCMGHYRRREYQENLIVNLSQI